MMPVLTIFTDFLSAVVTSEIVQILSLYGGGFLAEVEKLKWFCFDLALKIALYTFLKKKKKQSQYSVCYLQGQVKMASVTGQC